MSSLTLRRLLELAASNRLTGAEEEELRRLLAQPENQAQYDKEFALLRRQVAEALAYRAALRIEPIAPPAGRRTELLATVAALRSTVVRSRALRPCLNFRRWLLFAGAAVALLFAIRVSRSGHHERVQLALVGSETVVRGAAPRLTPRLGADWEVIELPHLRALADWTQRPLPPNVRARVWIDEEHGELRAVTRTINGALQMHRQPLNPQEPAELQLERFAASLPGAPS